MTSPTQRSLAHVRKLGWTAQVVEKFNIHAKVRVDLFNWIDVVAVKQGEPITGVQTTTGSNASERLAKARGNKALEAWLQAGGRLVIHSWRKRGDRGKRKVWTVIEREVSQKDLEGDVAERNESESEGPEKKGSDETGTDSSRAEQLVS